MFFALSLIMSAMRVEEQLEEQEKENIALKQTKVQVLETANIPLVEECSEAEHQMKVQLPLENWHDLLAFVPRSQLGNAVSEIGDYQFACILQSFLHDEVRKITLGRMFIISPEINVSSDQPMVQVWPNDATNMPDWPMPRNIKNFKEIELNYLNASVLNFLEEFQQNSLLTDVNMHFGYYLNSMRLELRLRTNIPRVLTKIAPFIASIDSIEARAIDLLEMAYNNNTNHGNNHVKEMLTKTRILVTRWCLYDSETSWEDKIDWCCSWLYTPRSDRKPRMLRLRGFDYASFIERIKKDFNEAKHADDAVSFFIYAIIYEYNNNIVDISFENVKTNEKLVIKKANHDDELDKLLIGRYPRKAAKNWIEAKEKEITEWDRWELDRKINVVAVIYDS